MIGRARVIREAILGFARSAALRNRMNASAGRPASRHRVTLTEGRAREAAGEQVWKQ